MNWFKFKKKKKNIISESSITNAQTERVESLKAEVHRLEKKIEEYVAREREIGEVLNFARLRAEEYEKEAKIRYTLEKERLSSYREKWQNRLETLKDADRLGEEVLECNEYFKKISKDLKEIVEGEKVSCDEPTETFVRETKRLKELGITSAPERVLSEEDLNKLLLQFNA